MPVSYKDPLALVGTLKSQSPLPSARETLHSKTKEVDLSLSRNRAPSTVVIISILYNFTCLLAMLIRQLYLLIVISIPASAYPLSASVREQFFTEQKTPVTGYLVHALRNRSPPQGHDVDEAPSTISPGTPTRAPTGTTASTALIATATAQRHTTDQWSNPEGILGLGYWIPALAILWLALMLGMCYQQLMPSRTRKPLSKRNEPAKVACGNGDKGDLPAGR